MITIPRRICGYFERKFRWKALLLGGLVFLILTTVYILASTSMNVHTIGDSDHRRHFDETETRSFAEYSNITLDYNSTDFENNKASTSINFRVSNNYTVDGLLVVDTPTCKIPLTDVMPPYYRNNWNWSSAELKIPLCDAEMKLFYFVKQDEVIKVTYENITDCYLKEIVRHKDYKSDRKYAELKKITLNSSRYINVSQMEMFILVCNRFYNFEANLHANKAEVKKKLKYWSVQTKHFSTKKDRKSKMLSETKVNDRLISVLWLGIDSTSRRHLHRSFPKTLKLLKEMDFLDFQGYHSIAPNTLENMIPFTTGYTQNEMRNKCQVSWTKPFDNCPFVWKHFNERNYVTAYIEDGSGTFYWGNGGGFIEQPTDYYLNPLFLAHKKEKENNTLQTKDCTSTETMPQFILRYTERFLQKFNSTPFFHMNWFANPFHDFEFALPNTDADFADFFSKISKDVNLLRNTLILLNADHGNRYGLFTSKSVEGFLERSLPSLYMRIPENLIRKFPHLNLKTFAEANSKLLTTPFDIHHTLLHVLDLNDKMKLTEKPGKIVHGNNSQQHEPQLNYYQPVQTDRSSLFAFIPDNRTCDSVHISNVVCACNVNASPEPVQDTFKLTRMIDYAVGELNSIVENSKYKDSCLRWEAIEESLISADILGKRQSSSLILLKFRLGLGVNALFEVKLRVSPVNATYDFVETEGEFVRISSYKETSWCVSEESEEDKMMKEFCLCKGRD